MEDLSYLSDNDLTKKVQGDSCSQALNELIDRHTGICYNIYDKYFGTLQTVESKEVKEHKDLLIYEAALSYDPNKGSKFVTWLGNMVTYACLTVCSKKQKYIGMDEEVLCFLIDSKVQENALDTKPPVNSASKELIDHIKDLIEQTNDVKARKVMELRYFSGNDKPISFSKIAKKMGYSVQAVINWHDKFIELLRKKLTADSTLDII